MQASLPLPGWAQVNILACKFLNADGDGLSSNAANCIKWCAWSRARVIQASWSGGGYSQAVVDAINYAATKNSLFVSSAGNKAANVDAISVYPPSYKRPNMVVVAAST